MQLLILFIGENERFDQNQLVDIAKNVPGVENIREGKFVGSILEFEFSEGEDFTTVRLSDDRETISISGLGNALFLGGGLLRFLGIVPGGLVWRYSGSLSPRGSWWCLLRDVNGSVFRCFFFYHIFYVAFA